MNKDYLLKTKSVLNEMLECLDTQTRNNFYGINSNIYSLMFDESHLKADFVTILPNSLSGHFANLMWNISRTGAYFGPTINGYSVVDIKRTLSEIIEIIKRELLKIEKTSNDDFCKNLLDACALMQSNRIYHDRKENDNLVVVSEDSRNYFLRDLLDFKGLYVRGQEHQGISLNGKGSGEVDILVCRTELQPRIYIECMNLEYIDALKIDSHYEKLFTYDASMNKNNFLISFVKTNDFASFCKRYTKHFIDYEGRTMCTQVEKVKNEYANIFTITSESKHGGDSIYTHHILVLFEQY